MTMMRLDAAQAEDSDAPPADRAKAFHHARTAGWVELWKQHGLVFPRPPDDILPAYTPRRHAEPAIGLGDELDILASQRPAADAARAAQAPAEPVPGPSGPPPSAEPQQPPATVLTPESRPAAPPARKAKPATDKPTHIEVIDGVETVSFDYACSQCGGTIEPRPRARAQA